jgi:Lrp/AsnC family transcriptional regulator for asnA, asnC and gidA
MLKALSKQLRETREREGMMFNEVKTTRLYNIDEIDAEIIEALDEDVRATYTSLAKRIGVDQVTIRRRLDKLLESGVIRLGVLVDYSRIGPSLHVLFALSIRADSMDSVLEQVGRLSQVSWVTSVTGRFDSIALARFASYDELGTFIHEDLNPIKGILRSETFVFLRREKSFYSPLERSSKSSFLVT